MQAASLHQSCLAENGQNCISKKHQKARGKGSQIRNDVLGIESFSGGSC